MRGLDAVHGRDFLTMIRAEIYIPGGGTAPQTQTLLNENSAPVLQSPIPIKRLSDGPPIEQRLAELDLPNRCVTIGEQTHRLALLAMQRAPSADFSEYWERHIEMA